MLVLGSYVVVIVANVLIIRQHANLNKALLVSENKVLNIQLTKTTLYLAVVFRPILYF